MNRFSRIRHHIDMKDVKQRHLEENVAKIIREKQIEEEKRAQKEIYDAWKSDWRQDLLDEGMTTQMLHGILPGAGETDLENIPTGSPDGDGNYTAFSIMGDMTTAEDPTGVGCWFRHPDNDFGNPSRASIQSFHEGNYSGNPGKEGNVPGYVPRAMRGVRPSGSWNELGPYNPYHLETRDELGLDKPRIINFALDSQGFGTHMDFYLNGSYMATRDIDTSEFDTMKIHAWVHSGQIKSESDKVELFYWAGNKPGFKSMWTGAPYNDGEGHESGHLKNNDGWRRINTKPDGTVDNSVKTRIIDHLRDGSKNGKLSAYSIHLPEWTRGKNSRFIITTFGQFARLKMTSMRFQRKNTLRVPSISKPLTDVEASPFVRVGQSVDQNAKQRRKRVRDMIKASLKYGQTKFGDGVVTSTNID